MRSAVRASDVANLIPVPRKVQRVFFEKIADAQLIPFQVTQATVEVDLREGGDASAVPATGGLKAGPDGREWLFHLSVPPTVGEVATLTSESILCPFFEPGEVPDDPADRVRCWMRAPVEFRFRHTGEVHPQTLSHGLVHLVEELHLKYHRNFLLGSRKQPVPSPYDATLTSGYAVRLTIWMSCGPLRPQVSKIV